MEDEDDHDNHGNDEVDHDELPENATHDTS